MPQPINSIIPASTAAPGTRVRALFGSTSSKSSRVSSGASAAAFKKPESSETEIAPSILSTLPKSLLTALAVPPMAERLPFAGEKPASESCFLTSFLIFSISEAVGIAPETNCLAIRLLPRGKLVLLAGPFLSKTKSCILPPPRSQPTPLCAFETLLSARKSYSASSFPLIILILTPVLNSTCSSTLSALSM